MKETNGINGETIGEFLKKHRIEPNAGFLLGVSGGADSMALLHLFREAGLPFEVMHCNFGLRGEESDLDEAFVRTHCAQHNLPLHVKRFDTEKHAADNGVSIEMAARELRYTWFAEIKRARQAGYIVVGHHADDLAETILINLCRGTGIKGLTGIKPIAGALIRPLLAASGTEIIRYNEEHNVPFRTDSSNRSDEYTRNLIRHKVIPVFKAINPSFLSTMQENCRVMKETEALFLDAVERLKKEVVTVHEEETLIHISGILKTPAPFTLLYEIVTPFGFNKTQVKDMLGTAAALPGKQFYSNGYVLTKDRDYWRLFRRAALPEICFTLPSEGLYLIGDLRIEVKILEQSGPFSFATSHTTVWFDADAVKFPLTVRRWKKGDAFLPFGMKGMSKKISDFFQGEKFSARQKSEALLLLSDNQIVWIINHRAGDLFKVTPSTRRILQIATTLAE